MKKSIIAKGKFHAIVDLVEFLTEHKEGDRTSGQYVSERRVVRTPSKKPVHVTVSRYENGDIVYTIGRRFK